MQCKRSQFRTTDSPASVRRRRRAFSFIEVLFAVMILGVGFIMIAAVFPVSLSQTAATNSESFAAAMARSAQRFVEQVAQLPPLPPAAPTDPSLPYSDELPAGASAADQAAFARKKPPVRAFKGDLRQRILPEMVPGVDARYAWLPFYARKRGHPYAAVYLFPTQVRAQSRYDVPPDVPSVASGGITDGTGSIDARIDATGIEFLSDNGGASPGAYVLVSWMLSPGATGTTDAAVLASQHHGTIYRLGNRIGSDDSNKFEHYVGQQFLQSYFDDDGDPATPPRQLPTINRAKVFVIGRGPSVQGTDATMNTPREGLGREIGVYTSMVRLRNF